MLNIVFFGSHQYSLYPLEALHKAGHKILAVITQPDKPVGRRQILTSTPVKKWALTHQIPVFTPEKLSSQFLNFLISQFPNIDLGVLTVYGKIIPKEILKLPRYGFLNLHPSLLPEFRGASPAQAAIILGKKETGITVFLMDEKLDHGPIIAQEKEEIKETDTAETLYHRLFKKGADLLLEILLSQPRLSSRASPWNVTLQDESKASYTRMLKRNDGFIPFEFVKAALDGINLNRKIKIDFIKDSHGQPFYILHSTFYINNIIRGLSPWPGAWSKLELRTKDQGLRTKRIKLLKSHLGNGKLILDEVQLEGKKKTRFKDVSFTIDF